MNSNKDTLVELNTSVRKALGEIVSLKQTCKQHVDTISELTMKNSSLTLDINEVRDVVVNLDVNIANLNKELLSHEELELKLEKENKALTASIMNLEQAQKTKRNNTKQKGY